MIQDQVSLASQGSFLERNLKAKEVETLIWISEEAEEMDEDNFVAKESLAAVIMEENNYEEHFIKLEWSKKS